MAPKAKKKNPNEPVLVPEDAFVRVTKLKDLKVAVKPPKGEFTREELCIAPPFQLQLGADFKQAVGYWDNCATIHYAERKVLQAPTRMKIVETEAAQKKPHTRKEIGDLLKWQKSFVKQSVKRTGQFLKQLEKREAKETKRNNLLKQIGDVDTLMNEELRAARRFSETQEIFLKKYMIGSKLGETCPKKQALIILELSEKQQPFVDEAKEEVLKLLNQVIRIEGGSATIQLATFSAAGVNVWMPSVPFQSKDDPKKGIDDAIKWLNKMFSPKTCGPQAFPPDWTAMLNKFAGPDTPLPYRIYMCCSRKPNESQEVLALLETLRQQDPPAKNEPVLPINVVAFDPGIVGDEEEKAFFEAVAGPHGSFLIDTTAEDLVALDKMLKAVAVKKKQLDKLNKKLDKMEDLSEKVLEDKELFQTQVALQRLLENDYELLDWALKNETPIPGPEI
eukprot:TRINITY_DN72155_c0_g1_i1.p1 TRINITY_DN72155_c0_g1~~TRINITY_DN72155_c0_g1_i1.p1  ORF type:complete len:448 (+),score=160.80 TRINITY_DN72155_c0_g1_i1:93-1436(+)